MIAVIWWPMMEGFYNKWFGWGPGYRQKLADKGRRLADLAAAK